MVSEIVSRTIRFPLTYRLASVRIDRFRSSGVFGMMERLIFNGLLLFQTKRSPFSPIALDATSTVGISMESPSSEKYVRLNPAGKDSEALRVISTPTPST